MAAVAVDGGAYFAYSARASADPSLPSVGHFQNVMSLAQSEIPVIFWGWGFLLLWISPSPIFLRLSSSSRRPIQWRSTTQKIKHGRGVINEWISPPVLGLRSLLRSWWWMLEDDNKTISWALVTAKMPRQLLELDSFVSKVSAIVSLIFKSPSRAEGSESKQLKKKVPLFSLLSRRQSLAL